MGSLQTIILIGLAQVQGDMAAKGPAAQGGRTHAPEGVKVPPHAPTSTLAGMREPHPSPPGRKGSAQAPEGVRGRHVHPRSLGQPWGPLDSRPG